MAISDAEFLQYLKGKDNDGLTIIFEIDFAYQTASGPAVGTVRFSDKPYDRDPAHRYFDCISKAPEFSRAIDVKKLGGRGTMTNTPLVLDNMDGRMDFMLDAITDAREARQYVGDQLWGREDFRLVNVAVVLSAVGTDSDLTLTMREKTFLLDDTIIGDPMVGGPNAGKPKPILLGLIKNFDITPYLFDSAALKYYINNFALQSFALSDVRDSGVSLITLSLFTYTSATMTVNTATDTLTRAAHGLAVNDVVVFSVGFGSGPATFTGMSSGTQYWVIASGLTANDFQVSLTKGGAAVDITGGALGTGTFVCDRFRYFVDAASATIQLSSPPSGRVTLDVRIVDAAGELTASAVPHQAFKYLLKHYTNLSASEYDGAAIDALISLLQNSIYYGVAILDRTNVASVLDEIARGTYSWYGWNAAGVLTVGQLDLPNVDSIVPIDSITEDDIHGDLQCENLALQWGKIILSADRNVVIQTDGLAASVSAASRSLWSQQFQLRVSTTDPATLTYLANFWDYHKSAIDSAPQELVTGASTSAGDPTFAQSLCDKMTDQFKPWIRPYKSTVGIDKYALNPGDCIRLSYPRYGLDNGLNVRVISVKPRFSEALCDLVLVRQVTPDYTMADYV
jgi:hypothetical protein